MSENRTWKYGDNINTDVIFAGKHTYTLTDPNEMAKVALEDLDPDFAAMAQSGDVIVAGRNWGNGSSREQAVTCLVQLGIRAVIAKSFARIYYRNAINNGLLVITCPEVVDVVEDGDPLTIDMDRHQIHYDGKMYRFAALPESVRGIVEAGGLIPYLKANYRS
jgi:3-isopropylmalate/(R)-2-methylmalate dehydratase small subunit